MRSAAKPLRHDFLWIVGVEGSGHHLVQDLLSEPIGSRDIVSAKTIGLQKDLESLQIRDESWADLFFSKFRLKLGLPPRYTDQSHKLRVAGQSLVKRHSKPLKILYSSSFPYGRNPRSLSRHTDIFSTVLTLRPYVNFKFIFLERDPVDCVLSACRRGFEWRIQKQMRFVDVSLIYIASQRKMIKEEDLFVLNYEKFQKAPQSTYMDLLQFIGVQHHPWKDEMLKIPSSGILKETLQNENPDWINSMHNFFNNRKAFY